MKEETPRRHEWVALSGRTLWQEDGVTWYNNEIDDDLSDDLERYAAHLASELDKTLSDWFSNTWVDKRPTGVQELGRDGNIDY